jgi:hypothetical protein
MVQDLVAGEDAAALELAAFGEGESHSMARIAECGDSCAEQNWMNVQADFFHQARSEKGLGQFAATHQTDALAGAPL